MKAFELAYLTIQPVYPFLYRLVRRRLRDFAKSRPGCLSVLDVGGRKSHYTIGLPIRVTITDLPRETNIQYQLNLGITSDIIHQLKARRSNVDRVLIDDMTQSALADAMFDCVVAVEVLEHVLEDDLFVRQVHRVLKPSGVFLMTTPNGDFVKNTNPDHKRHYTRQALQSLLKTQFPEVSVQFAVVGGVWHRRGLRSWSWRHPWRTLSSMIGNFVNAMQSSQASVQSQAMGSRHLLAVARKPEHSTLASATASLASVGPAEKH